MSRIAVMRSYLGSALFSASDLVNFTGCRHCTFLDLRDLLNGEEFRGASEPQAELLRQKGLEHERAFLSSLMDRGFCIAEIATHLTLEERVILTRKAMSEGADVIYQGALLGPPWHGYSDFLRRVETPSLLGAYSYEVIDTKLSRHARPKHVFQLCVYSELLAKEQDLIPVQMHIVLGDNRQESFRTADFVHFYHLLRGRFQTFAANPPGTSEPEPCGHCEFCRWNVQCQSQWESSEHLCLTAGITRNQSTRLRAANIGNLRVLAQQNGQHLRGFLPDTFTRLTSQAALQIRKRDLGGDWVEILPLRTAIGFNRLPEPDPGDLFFDMEGDPLYEGGLEYLFGFVRMNDDGEQFVPFWAHDRVQEKLAFATAVDFINDQLAKHPNAHIYHYNHYEMTALKRLASFHETRETDIDSYLRNHKFIDLYKVVREGVRISEPRYSLKNIEVFYMGQRDGTVKSAGDSTVSYEMWRQTHDPSLLEEIASYNHLDCRSTLLLQKWLLGIRPADSEYSPVTDSPDAAKTKKQEDREAIVQRYRSNLLESCDPDDQAFRELVAQLLEFHKREAKPEWWAMFDRQGRSEEELIDDAACLGGLRPDTAIAPFPDKRSKVHTFHFPPQDCKIKSGDDCLRSDTLEPAGEVLSIDDESLCVQLKIGPSRSPLPKELSLIPTGPIGDEALRAAIYRFADSIIAGDGRFGAVESVLRRNLPSINDRLTGEPVVAASAELLGSTVTAIEGLRNSHLLIQGPPGAGKTFISARVIVELLMRGHKVGVSSNSHKAINKLLSDVEQLAAERKFTFDGVKKSTEPEQALNGRCINDVFDNKDVDFNCNLIAGTAWLFARPEFDHALDYLFIDEAGQVAVANVVAMGLSARNIVLVGDQMQLSQPIQGVHPGDSGKSVLEYLLGEHATVPPDCGVFLPTTWRMHEKICRFISDAVYDGRLEPDVNNQNQRLVLNEDADPGLVSAGILFRDVYHFGCSQKSREEADEIRKLYASLLTQRWRDKDGLERPIGKDDVVVVSPYNMQVNLLREVLPKDARVGTVDKFQGQEAAVVLISMVTSSAEELPRDVEFLFSRNRLNVAISRARCLAVIVANPRLLEVPCRTVDQVKLVNTLCWARDYAEGDRVISTYQPA